MGYLARLQTFSYLKGRVTLICQFIWVTDLSFATILARRIHKLLQEKDERAGSKASDWLRSEALSGTGIQENGTFRKALWQRVYSSVIPILSEVIAFVDRDSNLELVKDEGNWLSRLWIQLFQSHSMVEFHYEAFLSLENGIIRERVPVITAGRERQVFELQFPFSWLIKETFDGMWRDACSIAGKCLLGFCVYLDSDFILLSSLLRKRAR